MDVFCLHLSSYVWPSLLLAVFPSILSVEASKVSLFSFFEHMLYIVLFIFYLSFQVTFEISRYRHWNFVYYIKSGSVSTGDYVCLWASHRCILLLFYWPWFLYSKNSYAHKLNKLQFWHSAKCIFCGVWCKNVGSLALKTGKTFLCVVSFNLSWWFLLAFNSVVPWILWLSRDEYRIFQVPCVLVNRVHAPKLNPLRPRLLSSAKSDRRCHIG